MGKFSCHLALVADSTHPCPHTNLGYDFVDYAHLTALANARDDVGFRAAWDEELRRASANFDAHYASATQRVVDAVFETEAYDPDHPALASPDPYASVDVLMKTKGRDYVLGLLHQFKALLQSASLNSEALHLALRKYDKRVAAAAEEAGASPPRRGMTGELLPKLYASTVYHATGARSLAGELEAVREFLELDDEEDMEATKYAKDYGKGDGNSIGTVGVANGDSKRLSESSESAREEELKWFMSNASGLEERDLAALVAHRGFHCERDDSVTRPIENSLSSFEYAWAAGIHLAECDVGVTKDERIIMAHDEDFQRLALLSDCGSKCKPLKELTLSDIMKMPLKHGNRPPLLVDVLRSAMAIGEHAKLVIEIKPGNSEIVDPLMMLFERHPDLLSRVAVIMSFDTYIMEDVADRFAVMNSGFGSLGTIGEGRQTAFGVPGARTTLGGRRQRGTTMSRARRSVSYGTVVPRPAGEAAPMPKLLVLTAHTDYNDGKEYLLTSVKDGFDGLSDKLPAEGGIDGVYIEYEPEMLEPEGREKLLRLAESYTVGVWMLKPRDPDALSVAKRLVLECGVSYVNTDFHRDFFSS